MKHKVYKINLSATPIPCALFIADAIVVAIYEWVVDLLPNENGRSLSRSNIDNARTIFRVESGYG